jgi:hypothetical protein
MTRIGVGIFGSSRRGERVSGFDRQRRRLSSECGVKLGANEVRNKSGWETWLQVIVEKLLLVRLGLPDLDSAYPTVWTRTSHLGHEAVRRTLAIRPVANPQNRRIPSLCPRKGVVPCNRSSL